jgi:hypothetical protein
MHKKNSIATHATHNIENQNTQNKNQLHDASNLLVLKTMQIKEDIGLKFCAHKLAPAQAPHALEQSRLENNIPHYLEFCAKKQITHCNFVKNIVISKQIQM